MFLGQYPSRCGDNALGIPQRVARRVPACRRHRLTGPSCGISSLAATRRFAARLDVQMDAAVSAAEAIPAPFDQAILVGSNGRKAVEATVAALRGQTGAARRLPGTGNQSASPPQCPSDLHG